MTLTEVLLAQIAEDEAVAREAITNGEGSLDWADDGDPTDMHIARWDPARVLAECEAKRLLIADLTSERHEVVGGHYWYTCSAADSRLHGDCDCGRDDRIARRLGILASAYSDHADCATARR